MADNKVDQELEQSRAEDETLYETFSALKLADEIKTLRIIETDDFNTIINNGTSTLENIVIQDKNRV